MGKRRVDQTETLQDEVNMWENKKKALQEQIQQLQEEKTQLAFILEAHKSVCSRVSSESALPEAAAVLLCHSWLCPLRGHGTFLSYDGFPPALRLLNTGCVEYRHLAPEERLLFPPAAVVQHNVAADWTFL